MITIALKDTALYIIKQQKVMDYANGKIYKIASHCGDKIYIGSTCQHTLAKRMTIHRQGYRTWIKNKCKKVSSFELFDEYGLENCFIELIELFPCNSKDELHKAEGKWIRELKCVNKYIAGRTRQERVQETKPAQKQYYLDNKERILIAVTEYRQTHKAEHAEYGKKYKLAHRAEVIRCECGRTIKRFSLAGHRHSKVHLKYMESI